MIEIVRYHLSCFDKMKWILDFEAFHVFNTWYPLEVCLLNCETEETLMYYIRWPRSSRVMNATTMYQMKRHCLRWDSGDIEINEFTDIMKTVFGEDDEVNVKGFEKVAYIKSLLPTSVKVVEIENAPPYKLITDYFDECCDKHFVRFCARVKCKELIKHVCFN